MSTLSFGKGVLLAALLSGFSALLFTGLALLWPAATVLKTVIALGAALYVMVLMRCQRVRHGRIALPLAWLLAAAVIAWCASELLTFVMLHSVLLWISRALCCHRSALSVLLDGMLCALAVLAAVVSARYSASVLLSFWSYFLVQALFVFIPRHWRSRDRSPYGEDNACARFDIAFNRAEAALRRLH